MKKKVLKKRTLLLLTTIILTITILIILSSQNQQTSQTQIDENKKALTTNSLKQETKNILQTLTNIHPVDLTLEILNIKNIFQQRNLILFSDTGYGDCTSDSQCDDGEFCNGQEICNTGSCISGNAPDCDDYDECTQDTCINNQCEHTLLTECMEEPDECQIDPDCDDYDECTQDNCINNFCEYLEDPSCIDEPQQECQTNQDCKDNDDCTEDICLGNICFNEFSLDCIDDPLSECQTDKDCDDYDKCTQDYCIDNKCFIDPLIECIDDPLSECQTNQDCNDFNKCTKDYCTNNKCKNTKKLFCKEEPKPYCFNNQDCNDFNKCTTDTCTNNNCINQENPDCDTNQCEYDFQCGINSKCLDGNCVCQPQCNGKQCGDDGCGGSCGNCIDSICNSQGICIQEKKPEISCETARDCYDGMPCTEDNCVQISATEKKCLNIPNNDFCDDKNICNGQEKCLVGQGCVKGASTNCNDNNPCIINNCNPTLGCFEEQVNCNDNNACTEDYCDINQGCIYKTKECNDNILCTIDKCNSKSSGCLNIPEHSLCNDSESCIRGKGCQQTSCAGCYDCDNWFTTCSFEKCHGNCYQPGECYYQGKIPFSDDCIPLNKACQEIINCEDYSKEECINNPCNLLQDSKCELEKGKCKSPDKCGDNTCSDKENCENCPTDCGCSEQNLTCSNKVCVECEINSDCDDNNICNGQETCTNNKCTKATSLNCNDNNQCTTETCDPILGCQYNNLICNDNKFCTEDSCTKDKGCVFEKIKDCEKQCETNQDCNDNNLCNGQETCIKNKCKSGTSLDCNDNDSCTEDSCSENQGCINKEIDSCKYECKADKDCDDKNVCNGQETCIKNKCTKSTPIECNDNNLCTVDVCDPFFFAYSLEPCQYTQKTCNDNNPFTIDTCNRDSGCINTKVECTKHEDCNDNNLCNGIETCKNNKCIKSKPLNCNDAFSCTDDSCNPEAGCINTPKNENCNPTQICNPSQFPEPTGCGRILNCTDADKDGILDYNKKYCPDGKDKCNDNTFFENNSLENYLPIPGPFTISNVTTQNLRNFTNFTIENKNIKIQFIETLDLLTKENGCFKPLDLNNKELINVEQFNITINTTLFPVSKKPAILTFNKVDFGEFAAIYKDNQECFTCQILQYKQGEILKAKVQGFSMYTASAPPSCCVDENCPPIPNPLGGLYGSSQIPRKCISGFCIASSIPTPVNFFDVYHTSCTTDGSFSNYLKYINGFDCQGNPQCFPDCFESWTKSDTLSSSTITSTCGTDFICPDNAMCNANNECEAIANPFDCEELIPNICTHNGIDYTVQGGTTQSKCNKKPNRNEICIDGGCYCANQQDCNNAPGTIQGTLTGEACINNICIENFCEDSDDCPASNICGGSINKIGKCVFGQKKQIPNSCPPGEEPFLPPGEETPICLPKCLACEERCPIEGTCKQTCTSNEQCFEKNKYNGVCIDNCNENKDCKIIDKFGGCKSTINPDDCSVCDSGIKTTMCNGCEECDPYGVCVNKCAGDEICAKPGFVPNADPLSPALTIHPYTSNEFECIELSPILLTKNSIETTYTPKTGTSPGVSRLVSNGPACYYNEILKKMVLIPKLGNTYFVLGQKGHYPHPDCPFLEICNDYGTGCFSSNYCTITSEPVPIPYCPGTPQTFSAPWRTTCTLDCAGKECGPDERGGFCGECPSGTFCDGNLRKSGRGVCSGGSCSYASPTFIEDCSKQGDCYTCNDSSGEAFCKPKEEGVVCTECQDPTEIPELFFVNTKDCFLDDCKKYNSNYFPKQVERGIPGATPCTGTSCSVTPPTTSSTTPTTSSTTPTTPTTCLNPKPGTCSTKGKCNLPSSPPETCTNFQQCNNCDNSFFEIEALSSSHYQARISPFQSLTVLSELDAIEKEYLYNENSEIEMAIEKTGQILLRTGLTKIEENTAELLLAKLYYEKGFGAEIPFSVWEIGRETISPRDKYLYRVFIKTIMAGKKEIAIGWSPYLIFSEESTIIPFSERNIKDDDDRFPAILRKTIQIDIQELFKKIELDPENAVKTLEDDRDNSWGTRVVGNSITSTTEYQNKHYAYINAISIATNLKTKALSCSSYATQLTCENAGCIYESSICHNHQVLEDTEFLLARTYLEIQKPDSSGTYHYFHDSKEEYWNIIHGTGRSDSGFFSDNSVSKAYLGLADLEVIRSGLYAPTNPNIAKALQYLKLSITNNPNNELAKKRQADLKTEIYKKIARGRLQMNNQLFDNLIEKTTYFEGLFRVGCPKVGLSLLLIEAGINEKEITLQQTGTIALLNLQNEYYNQNIDMISYLGSDINKKKEIIAKSKNLDKTWIEDSELIQWINNNAGNTEFSTKWGIPTGTTITSTNYLTIFTPDVFNSMKAFYIREEIDNKIKYEIHYDTFIMLEEYVHDINYAFCTTPDIAMVIADGDLATARYLVNTYCPSSTFPAGIMPQNLYFMFKTGEGYQFNSVSDQWYDGILTSFVSPLGAGSMIIGSTVNAVGSGFRVVSATTKAEITIAKAAKAAKSMSAWQARTSRAFSLRNTIQACKQTTTVSGRELLKKGVLRNVIGIRNTGIHVFSFTKTNILPDVLLDTSASYFLGPEFGNIVSYLGTLPGYKHAYALVDTAQNFPIGLRALEGHKTEFLNGLEKRLQDSGQTILNKGDDYLDVQLNINGQTINKRFIVYEQKTINGVNNEELTLKHLYDNHNIRGIVPVDLKARILDPSEASIPLDHPLAQFEEALSKSFCNAEGFDQAYAKEYLKEAYGLKSLPYLKAGEFVEINFDISLREVDDLLKKTKSVKETAKLTEIQKLTKIKITNAYLTTLGHIQNREFATATIKLSNGEHRTIVVAGVSHKVSYKDIKQFADDPNMYGAGNWEFVETGIHNHPNSQGYPSGATLKSDWETNCKGLDYCQFPYGKGDITNSITQGQKENVIGTIINGNYREVVYKVPSAKEYQGFLEQASKHDELVQLGQLDEAEKISPWVDGININGNYYGPFHGPLMRKMYGSDWRKLFENLKEPLDNPKFLPGGADYNLRPIGVDLPCGTIRSVKP